MRKMLLFGILLAIGCASLQTTTTIEIPIISKDLPRGVLGLCMYTIIPIFPLHEIFIDEVQVDLWDQSREMLVYHELGHCQFGLDHVKPTFFEDGCTKDLMATYLPPSSNSNACYAKHKEFYDDQFESFKLCSDRKKCPVQEFLW